MILPTRPPFFPFFPIFPVVVDTTFIEGAVGMSLGTDSSYPTDSRSSSSVMHSYYTLDSTSSCAALCALCVVASLGGDGGGRMVCYGLAMGTGTAGILVRGGGTGCGCMGVGVLTELPGVCTIGAVVCAAAARPSRLRMPGRKVDLAICLDMWKVSALP